MIFYKYIKFLFSFIILGFLFSGCVHNLNKEGLVVSINEKQLSEAFDESFPLKKDFVFGTIVVEEPTIIIPKKAQRIKAFINLDFQTMFTQKIIGDFIISGEPIFDKKTASNFLKNVEIESLKFTKLNLGHAFSKTFLTSLSPMMNKIFKYYPIYKIPKESFQGTFVKNIKIENSKLLITYGI